MDIEDLCRRVTEKTGEDYDIVKLVISWVFKFTTNVMKDLNDLHDILFNKLFKFKLKKRFRHEEVVS